MNRPNSKRNLDMAIRRLGSSERDYVRNRFIITNAIVGQMLPAAVVKGGSALKMRYGDSGTRATTDLDIAVSKDVGTFEGELETRLQEGWEGFTGKLKKLQKANPQGIPSEYVMQPYEIKLLYLNVPWCTVRLEVGHNEIGDADEGELVKSDDAGRLLSALGFPEPGPVPVMLNKFQIAQKLHASTAPDSLRAHDLVDLQIILQHETIQSEELRETCERLFAYRKQQSWPPEVRIDDRWRELYETASKNTSVAKSADDAVRFANDLICEIANTNCDSTAPEAELRQLRELSGPANGDRKLNRPLGKRA